MREDQNASKALTEEVQELKMKLQKKDEEFGNLEVTNQRLVKRVETLQNEKEKAAQATSAGGGWGFGFGGGGNQKNELEELKVNLQVTQEELECKILENCKYWKPLVLSKRFPVCRASPRENLRFEEGNEQRAGRHRAERLVAYR